MPVEEYAKANKLGEQAGASFGTLRKEEEAALKLWREYVLKKQTAGTPARPLDEILREAIEREETKDEITPAVLETAIPAAIERKKNGVPTPQ